MKAKTELQALLASVFDNYWDNTPRAVLADFIAERGDPEWAGVILNMCLLGEPVSYVSAVEKSPAFKFIWKTGWPPMGVRHFSCGGPEFPGGYYFSVTFGSLTEPFIADIYRGFVYRLIGPSDRLMTLLPAIMQWHPIQEIEPVYVGATGQRNAMRLNETVCRRYFLMAQRRNAKAGKFGYSSKQWYKAPFPKPGELQWNQLPRFTTTSSAAHQHRLARLIRERIRYEAAREEGSARSAPAG